MIAVISIVLVFIMSIGIGMSVYGAVAVIGGIMRGIRAVMSRR